VTRGIAITVCALLPLVGALIAIRASSRKCATMDEPLHAAGAFVEVFHGDYRINPEDPPLWKRWAMLPHSRIALAIDRDDQDFMGALVDPASHASRFATRSLYQRAGNDGADFVQRSRWMMSLIFVALAWVTSIWAWRIAGPWAAIATAALMSLDPNFLAHGPLVKNDVAISLLFVALAACVWSVGCQIRLWNVAALAIVCGVALATKFSGVLAVPILAIAMLCRAIIPGRWRAGGFEFRSVPARLLASGGICIICAAVSFAVIWASYGFRYAATPAGGVMRVSDAAQATARNQFFIQHGRFPDDAEMRSAPIPRAARLCGRIDDHRLLPNAYVYGLLFTYQSSLVRPGFLLGEVRQTGWWYYFPLAMLFKTPLATMTAGVAAVVVLACLRFWRVDGWTSCCILTPLVIYGASALTTNLNLGLRHALPLYPFFFVVIAIAFARAMARWPRWAGAGGAVLLVGLAIESAVAFPDYIAFFNAASRQHRLRLLSDSNLDWGQDLPALARWRREHPEGQLYLCYFGSVDPAFYRVGDYANLPPGFWLGPPYQWPDNARPGIIAISATYLQGNYLPDGMRDYYAPLRTLEPIGVLGESIYIYSFGSSADKKEPHE